MLRYVGRGARRLAAELHRATSAGVGGLGGQRGGGSEGDGARDGDVGEATGMDEDGERVDGTRRDALEAVMTDYQRDAARQNAIDHVDEKHVVKCEAEVMTRLVDAAHGDMDGDDDSGQTRWRARVADVAQHALRDVVKGMYHRSNGVPRIVERLVSVTVMSRRCVDGGGGAGGRRCGGERMDAARGALMEAMGKWLDDVSEYLVVAMIVMAEGRWEDDGGKLLKKAAKENCTGAVERMLVAEHVYDDHVQLQRLITGGVTSP